MICYRILQFLIGKERLDKKNQNTTTTSKFDFTCLKMPHNWTLIEQRWFVYNAFLFLKQFLPPATKLGQGNIFRSVCQEFCSHQGAVHAGRYGQQAGGTHPTGMHTCYLKVHNAHFRNVASLSGFDVSCIKKPTFPWIEPAVWYNSNSYAWNPRLHFAGISDRSTDMK